MIDELTAVSDGKTRPPTLEEGRANRAAALASGARTYIGMPCVRCGGTVRYVGSGGYKCKACNDARSLNYFLDHKEKLAAQKIERRQRRRLAAQMKTPKHSHEVLGVSISTTDRKQEHEYDTATPG